jgi:hypothetical protein
VWKAALGLLPARSPKRAGVVSRVERIDADLGATFPHVASSVRAINSWRVDNVVTRGAMTIYAAPGTSGAKVTFKPRYEHWIGGEWVKPVKGQYFEDISSVNGKPFAEVARGTAEDIEAALDAAHDEGRPGQSARYRHPGQCAVLR